MHHGCNNNDNTLVIFLFFLSIYLAAFWLHIFARSRARSCRKGRVWYILLHIYNGNYIQNTHTKYVRHSSTGRHSIAHIGWPWCAEGYVSAFTTNHIWCQWTALTHTQWYAKPNHITITRTNDAPQRGLLTLFTAAETTRIWRDSKKQWCCHLLKEHRLRGYLEAIVATTHYGIYCIEGMANFRM